MTLSAKDCAPCEGDERAFSVAEAQAKLADLPGWELKDDARWLFRAFTFKNFRQAQAFFNAAGDICEQQQHHADFEVGWGYCRVRIQTHTLGGLHGNDFILAAKISAAAHD